MKFWLAVLVPPGLLMLLLVLMLLNVVKVPLRLMGRSDPPPPLPPLPPLPPFPPLPPLEVPPVTVVESLSEPEGPPPPETLAVLVKVQGALVVTLAVIAG